MINILADQYLYNITSYLPEVINLERYDPVGGLPDISNADAILIRTVNDINEQTLPHIPDQLSFIGTASAGTDHVDTSYLKRNGVSFTNAAGCNARSVAEYVATSLLYWAEAHQHNLSEFSVGIVGVGHVGTQVQKLLHKLNIRTVAYDPPRQNRESNFDSATLNELLQCDILTFHTPLTHEGSYATHHWLDEQKLDNHSFSLIINAARGGVIDEQETLKAMADNTVEDLIIDVWESEPEISLKTAQKAFITTPHIAGYSIQAKKNASEFAANAMLDCFGLDHPSQDTSDNAREFTSGLPPKTLKDALDQLHPLKEYEQELQKTVNNNPGQRGHFFNKLRAEFPLRREFANIQLSPSYLESYPILRKLGFGCA